MVRLVDVYEGDVVRKFAIQFLYDLMIERDPEVNISHKRMPTFEQHRQFVSQKSYRFWYLIEYLEPGAKGERLWVGTISATTKNEIGVALQKRYRHLGLGPMAIRAFVASHQPLEWVAGQRSGEWLANIAPGNLHSKYVFQKLGFTKIQETYSLRGDLHAKRHQDEPE